jgi:hypothetical protein
LADYADALTDKAFTPREYIEHQLEMTPEEIEARGRFFEEQFRAFNERTGSLAG